MCEMCDMGDMDDMVGASSDDQQGEELSVWTVQWHRVTVDKWNPFDRWWSGKLAIFSIVNVWYVIKNDV